MYEKVKKQKSEIYVHVSANSDINLLLFCKFIGHSVLFFNKHQWEINQV